MGKSTESLKSGLIRRQHMIYVTLMGTGVFLIVMSQMVDTRMLSEGIAFLIVGFVGMLMSWTTFDIGQSIKEAILQVGAQNQAALDRLDARNDRLDARNDRLDELLNQMIKSNERMEGKLTDIQDQFKKNSIN